MNQHPSDLSTAVDIFSAVTPHVLADSGNALHLSHLSLKRCHLLQWFVSVISHLAVLTKNNRLLFPSVQNAKQKTVCLF